MIGRLFAVLSCVLLMASASPSQDREQNLHSVAFELRLDNEVIAQPRLSVRLGEEAEVTALRDNGYSIRVLATRDESRPPSDGTWLTVRTEVSLRDGQELRRVAAPVFTVPLNGTTSMSAPMQWNDQTRTLEIDLRVQELVGPIEQSMLDSSNS